MFHLRVSYMPFLEINGNINLQIMGIGNENDAKIC